MLVGSLQVVFKLREVLDRFGLRFSIIDVGISFWEALSVDFESDLLLRTSNMLSS